MSILDDMRAGDALQQARSDHQLAVRVLTLLAAQFSISVPFAKNDPEYGLSWFNRTQQFHLHLVAIRTPVDSRQLLKHPHKTKLWKEYMAQMEEHDFAPIGLITPALGTKLWIIHNWWHLPPLPGSVRVELPATDENKGTAFETLESFATRVLLSGKST